MRTTAFIIAIVATASAAAGAPAAAPACPAKDSRAKRSDPMHAGFDKARESFCDHTARALKLPRDRILVSPIEEDPSVQLDQRIGAAWAFYGTSKDHPQHQVRGWATGDGTVITPDQNLGLLLAEAGAWSAGSSPDALADRLAERLVWAMGADHRVVGPRRLHVEPGGAGTLSFQVAFRPPGPGGAGGGRDRISQCTVALTADHHARLTTAAVAAPPAPSFE